MHSDKVKKALQDIHILSFTSQQLDIIENLLEEQRNTCCYDIQLFMCILSDVTPNRQDQIVERCRDARI